MAVALGLAVTLSTVAAPVRPRPMGPLPAEVRAALARAQVPAEQAVIAATASIGLSCRPRVDFGTAGDAAVVELDAIIARADRALFDAKRRGGNTTINISPA